MVERKLQNDIKKRGRNLSLMYLHFLSKLKVLRQSTYLWILIVHRDKFDVNITPSKFVTNIFHNF